MAKNNDSGGGVGVLTVLGLIFVVLKLTGVINWSWWLVTMPFWIIPLILVLITIIIVAIKLLQKVVK